MRIIIISAIIREVPENQSDSGNMAFNGNTLASLKRGQRGIIEAVDAADAKKMAEKLEKGTFDLNDMAMESRGY